MIRLVLILQHWCWLIISDYDADKERHRGARKMISAMLDWSSCWLSLFDRVRLDALALIWLPMFQSIPTFAIVNQGSRARINDCNDLIMNCPWRCQWHHIAVFILSPNQTYQHDGLPSPYSKEFWISGCIRQAMHPWAHDRLLLSFCSLKSLWLEPH